MLTQRLSTHVFLAVFSSGLLTSQSVSSQSTSQSNLWQSVPEEELKAESGVLNSISAFFFGDPGPKDFSDLEGKKFYLNSSALEEILSDATALEHKDADEFELTGTQSASVQRLDEAKKLIPIPFPDGSEVIFAIEPSHAMSAELARQFPEVRSFRGIAVDSDDSRTLRLDISPSGLHAEITSLDGNTIVAPTDISEDYLAGRSRYISFNKILATPLSTKTICETESDSVRDDSEIETDRPRSRLLNWGGIIRTYRLAIAATPEYVAKVGETKEIAFYAIVRTVNRLNSIYERELAIRLELVADNINLVFDDNSMNLNNGSASILIDESQKIIDSIIGDANYDLGHMFSTGAGGLAEPGSVGISGIKASGVTGNQDPLSDPYDVDFVAHEIGHQFGAHHTFNGENGHCTPNNWNAETAYEPGSGSTIMAYAGICDVDNVQEHSDDYFHYISLREIISHVSGAGEVTNRTQSTNTIPTVILRSHLELPTGTPFLLGAAGSDENPYDSLTYAWEQLDRGTQAPRSASDDGSIPLIKSEKPSVFNIRDVYNYYDDTGSPLIRLPSLGRKSVFVVTVRDNHAGGGGLAAATISVNFHDSAGPFRVTKPDSDVSRNARLMVEWDVANTDEPPVSAEHVNIVASYDGGVTFPYTLLRTTPNDGSEEVAMTGTPSMIMIKVESSDGVFYALSENQNVN